MHDERGTIPHGTASPDTGHHGTASPATGRHVTTAPGVTSQDTADGTTPRATGSRAAAAHTPAASRTASARRTPAARGGRTLRAAAVPALGGLLLAVLPALPAQAAGAPETASGSPANAGFEADGETAAPSGWTSTARGNAAGTAFTEPGGHDGGRRLTHRADHAYRVETSQRLTGLDDGPYTVSAWVRSSGGQKSATIALRDCGAGSERTQLPPTADGAWIRITASAEVRGGSCTIALTSDARPGQWAHFDDITLTPGAAALSVRGGDVSTLAKNEAFGARYRHADGTEDDALSVLGSAGMNYARLKVWVDPVDGYNTKERVLAMAQRIRASGMQLFVDFHYSDAWADPGKQNKPAAWSGHSYQQLRQDVYDHTYDVLSALAAQGTPAGMVQIGNEINGGMLWPEGSIDNWDQLAGLLKSGAEAARAASPDTRIALHLAEGGDREGTHWWFDRAVAHDVPFDVVALSYYGYWHGPLSGLQANLDATASRYGKPVLVAETAYAHTLENGDDLANNVGTADQLVDGYPATPQGQAAN
ncbi:glycosyl hydrolase 53 family protein, partial [Streptomyces sp. NPDC048845]|uniref:glycosyl hydrolase 53 family protein n=1 Tax=Streptomyces sp. NPDC048845 TaxID=3155390 RepID=UPI003446087F